MTNSDDFFFTYPPTDDCSLPSSSTDPNDKLLIEFVDGPRNGELTVLDASSFEQLLEACDVEGDGTYVPAIRTFDDDEVAAENIAIETAKVGLISDYQQVTWTVRETAATTTSPDALRWSS